MKIVRIKGVSPLIATVLLIAFTIAVAGIISVWLTQFTTTTTQTVSGQGTTQILCGTGGIALSNVQYCNATGAPVYVTGYISNTGSIGLGNITMTILYADASRETAYLNNNGGTLVRNSTCCGNFTFLPTDKYLFNFTFSKANIDTIRVTTNCTTLKVTDEAVYAQDEITKSC